MRIADLLSVMSGLRGNSNKLYCRILELLIFNSTYSDGRSVLLLRMKRVISTRLCLYFCTFSKMDDGVSPAVEWEPYAKQLAKSRNGEKAESWGNI